MKIAEVSKQSGLSPDTLRYYERIGLLPPVNRNDGGIRDYSELDVRRVGFIKCMRSAGLPIPERNPGSATHRAFEQNGRNAENPGFIEPQNRGVRKRRFDQRTRIFKTRGLN